MFTLQRHKPIPKVAWFAAVASVVTKAEAAAVIRSGAQSVDDLLAIEALSVETKRAAKGAICDALREIRKGIDATLELLAQEGPSASASSSSQHQETPSERSFPYRLLVRKSFGHLCRGQIEIIEQSMREIDERLAL